MPVSTALQLITVATGKLHYVYLAMQKIVIVKNSHTLPKHCTHTACIKVTRDISFSIDLDLYM